MPNYLNKMVFIIEGPDASGKSSLSKFIQDYANGKCHTIHSNFNKDLPKKNHRRQHKLIINFVKKQFNSKYYTGNNIVVLDRCYFSDIVYGTIGYGTKGTLEQKIKYFNKLIKKLTKDKTIKVFFIYCSPSKGTDFNPDIKEELLDKDENFTIVKAYNDTINKMLPDFKKDNLKYYLYDYNSDSDYSKFLNFINRN